MRRLLPYLALAAAVAVPAALAFAHDDDESGGVSWSVSPDSGTHYFDFRRAADRPWLGVGVEEETELSEGGARVTFVVEDSPAEEAGIRKGDVIVSVDGQPVRGPAGLTARLAEQEAGESFDIEVQRDGRVERLPVELADRPASVGIAAAPRWKSSAYTFFSGMGRPRLGVQLVDVTDELREHLGAKGRAGVLVSKVIAGSPAEDAGIRVGDLIVGLDGETIESSGDLQRAVRELDGEDVDVELVRDGRTTSVPVSFPEADDSRPTGPRAGLSWVSPQPALAAVRFAPPAPPPAPAPAIAAPTVITIEPPRFSPPPAPPVAPVLPDAPAPARPLHLI